MAADLDRLFAAAREQAHDAASHDASARPDLDAPHRRPDHPVADEPAVAAVPAADGSSEVDELAARRHGTVRQVVSQVAAVALLVVAVGAGVAGARDGGTTLNALLGRDTGEPAPESPDDPSLAVPLDGADASDDSPDTDAAGGEVAPSADNDGQAEPDATDRDEADAADSSASEGDGARSDADTSSGSGSGSNGSSGSTGGTDEDTSQDSSGDELSEDGEVVAAPPEEEEEVDGFGGRSDCDGEELADCTPEGDDADDGDDSDADADGGDDGDDASEGDEADDGDTDAAEDLARRRFSGSSDDGDDAAGGDEDEEDADDGDADGDEGDG